MPQSVLEWDLAMTLLVQTFGDWLIRPMNLITFTGNIEFYLLLLPALYWCFDKRLGLWVGSLILLSIALNLIIKITLHLPRPYWTDARVRLLAGAAPSFGLPSGHAQNAIVLWGMLAAYLQKGWAWGIAVALMVLTGFSRVFLGVHFPLDVLAGWAAGLIILLLFLRFEQQAEKWLMAWLDRRPVWQSILWLFLLSVILILVGVLVAWFTSTAWQLPSEWADIALVAAPDEPFNPLALDELIISASALFGLGGGALWLSKRATFSPRGPWLKRVARYFVGIAGVFTLWLGLGDLFDLLATDESPLGYTLRYIRYSLIGAWVSLWGPLLFLSLRLADVETQERTQAEAGGLTGSPS